ncbi:MAG: PSD1 and planctomycete cytochrome C domain-containing protein [Pirellulales bacterium]
MTRLPPPALPLLLACLLLAAPARGADDERVADSERMEFFERRIRPVLVERCQKCHGADAAQRKGGLRLDTAAGLAHGGDSGPALAPGEPDKSLLWHAVSYSGNASEMPPDAKLSPQTLDDFRRWIADGAVFPAAPGDGDAAATTPRRVDIAAGRQFWSFQPLRSPPPPPVAARHWPLGPIDAFVLAPLEANKLTPAPVADRRTLLRRAWESLVGLPPPIEELHAFTQDDSPDALERQLDRLFASPRFGERWGRHWLDVARYAEDNPTSESTCPPPRFAYRYRDWVVRAFNEDLPYDDFVRRQLAADLYDLPPSEIAALGFLGLSPVYHKEPKLSADVIATIVADEWDERLDAVTRGFLGLTVACARCHDHKFDPIRTEDYYALAGVIASTQLVEWPLTPTAVERAAELTDVQWQLIDAQLRFDYAKRQRETAKQAKQDLASFNSAYVTTEAEVKRLKALKLHDGPIANAVRDAGLWINGADPTWTYLDYRARQSRDLPVFIRGNALRHGPIVPRRFLEVFDEQAAPFVGPGSGRRELAESLVGAARPLATRVFVNRVWGWQFGQGLVRTPSNFGRLGEAPSHPELLEHLAYRFAENSGSTKRLLRDLLSSATWRQSVAASSAALAKDPDNRLLSRTSRKRLEPEAWRDTLLALAGELDLALGGPSQKLDDAAFHRRTIYASVSRQRPADLFKLFDFPDAKQHGESRLPTTTPLQHLYLLNSPFVQRAAESLANETPDDALMSVDPMMESIFERVLLRRPTDVERDDARKLLASDGWPEERSERLRRATLLAHALLATNEVLYVD